MSSAKMRMRVRIHRLQDIYKSLGKEPNAKDYEIKGLIQDFDKVSRKQIAALKKGKAEKLVQRANLLQSYGLQSRERITIDEEINSMIKIFESNMKRLNGIIVTYQDKKGKEIESEDVKKRQDVIYILRATMQLFKYEYEK